MVRKLRFSDKTGPFGLCGPEHENVHRHPNDKQHKSQRHNVMQPVMQNGPHRW